MGRGQREGARGVVVAGSGVAAAARGCVRAAAHQPGAIRKCRFSIILKPFSTAQESCAPRSVSACVTCDGCSAPARGGGIDAALPGAPNSSGPGTLVSRGSGGATARRETRTRATAASASVAGPTLKRAATATAGSASRGRPSSHRAHAAGGVTALWPPPSPLRLATAVRPPPPLPAAPRFGAPRASSGRPRAEATWEESTPAGGSR
eukprot:6597086-Prymnesium_polylepis.1